MKKILLVSIFLISLMSAQEKLTASFEAVDGKVIITYEFSGESEKEYEVKAILKKTSSVDFTYTPKLLSGDIGKGKFANTKHVIIWQFTQNETEKLIDEDYYFEVTAVPVKSGIPWYYYVGTAVAGGGAAAILLLKKKPDESTTSNTAASPPARP